MMTSWLAAWVSSDFTAAARSWSFATTAWCRSFAAGWCWCRSCIAGWSWSFAAAAWSSVTAAAAMQFAVKLSENAL